MNFKVGDKVRCVKEDSFSIKKDSFLNLAKVNVGEIYTVESCGLGAIRVKEIEGAYWMECFELAFPPLPDLRDRVPSVGKMVGVLPVDGCDTLDALMYWQSAYNRSLIARISPTVTKIIHNGTTTITFFSDGKKVITRPSQDDLEKYDPFVGWCVGVVEHLYGGKEKAKKFYKKHAVVQKEAQARASLNGNRRRGN